MTNRRRGLLVGIVVTGALLASLAVAVAAYMQRLPEIEQADRRGLCRWLIECELRDQTPEVIDQLIRRVDAELLAGIDLRKVATMVTPEQRVKLFANADYLARCWYLREADHYLAQTANDRRRVLAEQLEHFHRLGIMEQLSAIEDPTSPANGEKVVGNSSAMASLGAEMVQQSARVNRWIQASPPGERERMAQYFSAIQNRLLTDAVRKWLPTF